MWWTLFIVLVATSVVAPASAGPTQDRILETYLAESRRVDPSVTGFSAERGRALYIGPMLAAKQTCRHAPRAIHPIRPVLANI